MHTLCFATGITTIISLISSALAHHLLDERIAIIGSFIGLQSSYNTGIAFGIHLGSYQDIIIITALVLITIVAVKSATKKMEHIGFGLIIGGGIANLLDRAIDGKVTDMIQVGTFPIFNIADVAINLGVILIICTSLSFFKKEDSDDL